MSQGVQQRSEHKNILEKSGIEWKKQSVKMSGEDDSDWEYYDDTTTLTDLWQHLKNECLENDPAEFWLKAPLVDLQAHVHDYWRLKVPLVLAPSHGYTSVDQPVSEEIFKNSLIYCLEAFISGVGEHPREVFQVKLIKKGQSRLKVIYTKSPFKVE